MRSFTELYRMDLPHRAISVYIYLSDRANKENTCYPHNLQRSEAVRIHQPLCAEGSAESGTDQDGAAVSRKWRE